MRGTLLTTRISIILLALAALNIGILAILDPQVIFDNLQKHLSDITAKNSVHALFYIGGFMAGRIIGLIMDAMSGSFVMQWLTNKTIFSLPARGLLCRNDKALQTKHASIQDLLETLFDC